MAKYLVLVIAAVAMAGCTTYERRSAAGGTAATHDVSVQMDQDGSVRTYRTYSTDFNLREGDRVQVQADGKVAPL